VPDGSDVDFEVPHEDSGTVPKAPTVSGRRPSTINPGQAKRPSTLPGGGKRPGKASGPDSSVQMVPLDESSDSDVKVHEPEGVGLDSGRSKSKTASDSDIRLEQSRRGEKQPSDDALVTEEIDL